MRPLNLQFFLLFGSFASVQPFLPLLMEKRGLSESELGYALGVAGFAIMLSPAIITLIADTRMQPRRLMASLFVMTGISLVCLLLAQSFWMLLVCNLAYTLAITSMIPLQDGIAFGFQKMQSEQGEPVTHYNRIRVWGTYGYILILLCLYYPLKLIGNLDFAVFAGLACFAIGFANSFFLPDRGRRETAKRAQGLPSSAAMRALFGKGEIIFASSMFLLLAGSSAYHSMYPLYLSRDLGLASSWVGIVIAAGAVVEVFAIHALSGLERRFGLRMVMLLGVALTVARFGLMWGFPNLIVAIGTQVFHGAMICVMLVIPPTYVNGLATDANRNSIQGVYTMLIVGTSRFVGTVSSGYVAERSMEGVFLMCSIVCALAFGLLAFGFRPANRREALAL